MLKFDIIESEEDKRKSNCLYLMRKCMDPSIFDSSILSESKDVSYILGEGRRSTVVGGAVLMKKDLNNIQEDIKLLVTDISFQKDIWECSHIFIVKSEENAPFNNEYNQRFYRGLYEKLVEFASQKEISFIIMKLTQAIYHSTKEEGKWPYVVELKAENSPDAFFHGILPLVGSQYEAYQKAWKI